MKPRIRFKVFHSIIVINTFLISITGFTILAYTSANSERTALELGRALMNEIAGSVRNKAINYFEPAERAARETAYLIHGDALADKNNPAVMLGYFNEVMAINPELTMVYYADMAGDLRMSRRMPDGSVSYRFVDNDGQTIRVRWEHSNPVYFGDFPNSESSASEGYDPRKRGWFMGAVAKRAAAWTPAYIFATDRTPGFSCAVPVYTRDGALKGVASVDIPVAKLSMFLGTIQPTPGARLFLFDDANTLVAIQVKTKDDMAQLTRASKDAKGVETLNLVNGRESDDPLIRAVVNAGESSREPLVITSDQQRYQALMERIVTTNGLSLRMGIVIPEDDIIGNARRNAMYVLFFSVGMIVLALLISIFLSRAIADPLRVLSQEMRKIRDFVLDGEMSQDTFLQEIDTMQTSFESMKVGLKNFRRYVPADLVQQLINEGAEAGVGGEKRTITVFFSDIKSFTSISEGLSPEELVKDLSSYFDVASRAILAHQGTVDKYIGDAVMAFWGAPIKLENHAELACRSAIRMRDDLATLFRQWENSGKQGFHTRMGIHSGEAIVGNMGHAERLNYTAIGDTVNIGSRLEGLNKAYGTGIMVSESTWEQAKDKFEFRRLDKVALIGKQQSMLVYELIAEKHDIDKGRKQCYRLYETGLHHYFEGEFRKALQHFATVLKYLPKDKPSQVMKERCERCIRTPPEGNWDGVFTQEKK